MDRENNVECNLDNFISEFDSLKEKVSLFVRSKAVLKHENLKLKEELESKEVKCEELNGTIARLVDEQKQIREKGKLLEEELQRSKMILVAEQKQIREKEKMLEEELQRSKMRLVDEQKQIREKEKMLEEELQLSKMQRKELSGTISRLVEEQKENLNSATEKSKLLAENEKLKQKIFDLDHSFRLLDARVLKLGKLIEDLAHKKLVNILTYEELRQKPPEANQVNDQLNLQPLDAPHTASKSRQKTVESYKAFELTKSRVGMEVDTKDNPSSGFNPPLAEITDAGESNGCEHRQGLDNERKGLQHSGCLTKRVCPSNIIEINDSDGEDDNSRISQVFGGLEAEEGSNSEDESYFDARQNNLVAKLESIASKKRRKK